MSFAATVTFRRSLKEKVQSCLQCPKSCGWSNAALNGSFSAGYKCRLYVMPQVREINNQFGAMLWDTREKRRVLVRMVVKRKYFAGFIASHRMQRYFHNFLNSRLLQLQ